MTGLELDTRWRPRFEFAVALLAFSAGVAWYLGPAIASIRGHLGPDLGDPRLNLYFVTWVAHSIESGFRGLWSPPFFHPTEQVLAFSDHLIGPGVAVWLLGKLGVGPVTAFNLLFLASFVLSGTFAFWLFRRLRVEPWPALLGAWFVAFSHARWGELSHYQVLRAQWIPLVLWCFDRLLERPRASSAAAFLAVYLLHVSGGTYLALMIHVPMLVIVVVRLHQLGWSVLLSRERRRWLVGSAALALVLLGSIVGGYVAALGSRTIARNPEEVRKEGAILASLAAPSHGAEVRRLGFFAPSTHRGHLFPGFVILIGVSALLAGIAVSALARRPKRLVARTTLLLAGLGLLIWALSLADAYTLLQQQADWLARIGLRRYNGPRVLALIACLAIWLALRREREAAIADGASDQRFGPFERSLLLAGLVCLALALPIGFTAVHDLLPGMSGMRVAHRFFVFVQLALAFLGALGVQQLVARLRARPLRVAALSLLSVLAVAESTPRTWSWKPVPERAGEFPAYVDFLATDENVEGYLELPLYGDHRETEWMQNQTRHWKPMVNGYSARFTNSYRRIAKLFDPFPDDPELARLRSIGVSHLVVHWRARGAADRARWRPLQAAIDDALSRGAVERVHASGDATVLRLTAPRSPAAEVAIVR